jgi:hypothetical protein
MKEKALELRTDITRMKDSWEELTMSEREVVKNNEKKYSEIAAGLSEKDKEWVEDGFAAWYSKYLEVETKIFIKPCEG